MKITKRNHTTEALSGHPKTKTFIIFGELSQREIYALLKCNIHTQMRQYDPINEKYRFNMELRERMVTPDGKLQYIRTNQNSEVKPIQGIDRKNLHFVERSYEDILLAINPEYVLSFEVASTTYEEKKELIEILGDIKPSIIDSCVFIDYSNDCFIIENKPTGNGPDRMCYFPDNRNLLIFNDTSVNMIWESKYQNVFQLMCGDE
jgi:hypothetical protein